ncbi:MAG: hypothetical protein JST68_16380 [Bacteroidetes bacterium]|nr:hypothetical protein [Bacteroidota bacterium]
MTGHEYQSVDYSVRKPSTGKTLALIGGVIAIGVLVALALAVNNLKD